MVDNKKTKRQRDIKAKLMAAIAMLLVSSIMMVSTTYAWFTLSTAPEVTGITTAVGANGNLEMALQPLDGNSANIKSSAGDSMDVQFAYLANTTWGNLVDVSDNASYGLDNIMLYPAKLNTETSANNLPAIATNPLMTPEYGSDGRVSNLVTKSVTGVYDGDKFVESTTTFGVRAVGTSSSMSDRQLAYRAALAAANTAAAQAKRSATQSLNSNGANLADIAIKHATTADGAEETYSTVELGYLEQIVDALLAEEGPLEYIEDSLIQYALAIVLSGISDDNYAGAVSAFAAADKDTLTGIMQSYDLDTTNAAAYNAIVADLATLDATSDKVVEAQATLKGLLYTDDAWTTKVDASTTYEWSDFSSALTLLANPNSMEINKIQVSDLRGNWKYNADVDGTLPSGYTVGEDGYVYDDEGAIVSNMGRLVDAVLNEGLQLIIRSGAGVYADIADFAGDYSASVTLSKVSYGGMTVKNLDATMMTATNQDPTYLAALAAQVPAFTAGTGTAASIAISDFYGYILDLAFRTNVSGSSLQLQQQGIDRIYSNNTANEATMGGGASMTFQSTEATFSGVQVKSLMECIRIVFFDTDSKEIIGYARLDVANATEDSGKITAVMYMTDDKGVALTDNIIMDLEQNTVHELSVLVYLDGEDVTNADVANAASSMTGTMNLQFSSTATLTPMEYTDLLTGTDGGASFVTLSKVTGNGVTVGAAAYDGTNVVIQLKGVNEGEKVKVKIGDASEVEATVASYNSYTGIQVPATGVTADTVITVTYEGADDTGSDAGTQESTEASSEPTEESTGA